jgi:hypothetical protein
MVRSIKLIGLAFVAVLALGVVVASSASATPLIRFTHEGEFKSDQLSSSAKLETKEAQVIECTKFTSKGSVTGEDKAHVLIEFEKCGGPSGTTCTTTEGGTEVGTSGNIHVLALALLGSDAAPPLDLPAVLITTENKSDVPANVTFKCQLFSIGPEVTVEGSVIGLVSNLTSVNPGILLHLNKVTGAPGAQQDTHFWDESKTNVLDLLFSTGTGTGGFAKQESSEEASALLLSSNLILVEVK